ncbi:putative uncharacterized protein DDB_G0292292 [Microplitis demolitor]|uniref:putative uncharacterized protein DDB_G0292292 n=1 Tax=Microplitis demolitor TaxID=69319 RepID=UPI0004CC9309|nr:putative uncharacterized protein DDB_G0292292 [Microplitis demolitor]
MLSKSNFQNYPDEGDEEITEFIPDNGITPVMEYLSSSPSSSASYDSDYSLNDISSNNNNINYNSNNNHLNNNNNNNNNNNYYNYNYNNNNNNEEQMEPSNQSESEIIEMIKNFGEEIKGLLEKRKKLVKLLEEKIKNDPRINNCSNK